MAFLKFNKIGAFHNAIKYARKHAHLFDGPVSFEGTVKLHGTNAGLIMSHDGSYNAQSRNRALSIDDDNCGFAAWATDSKVCAVMENFAQFVWAEHRRRDVVVYGEWIGPGIQKGVAINKLPEKQFVVFGAAVRDDEGNRKTIYSAPTFNVFARAEDEEEITEGDPRKAIRCVHEAPTWTVIFDPLDEKSSTEAAEYINEQTTLVGKRCPWGAMHGIEGVGEGIVWTPMAGLHFGNSDLFFKSKAKDENSGLHAKKANTSAPASPNVLAFVEAYVHQERINQGIAYVQEAGKEISMQSTGDFLKWVNQDVQAECKYELEASNLTWKDVQKHVNNKAMTFWRREVSKL